MEAFKIFWWALSLPFVYLHFLLKFLRAKRKARKYKRNPDDFLDDEKYDTVYKLARIFLYTKRINLKYFEGKGFKLLNKPQLVVVNHRSNLDAILTFVFLYKSSLIRPIFIAKKELEDSSIGPILSLIDTIFIERDNLRQAVASLDIQKQKIKENKMIILFPEGTRNTEEELLEFKSGAFELAYKTMVPIQPIVIAHQEKHMEEKRKTARKDKKAIAFEVLEPLQPANFINIDRNILAKKIREQMQTTYNKIK